MEVVEVENVVEDEDVKSVGLVVAAREMQWVMEAKGDTQGYQSRRTQTIH